MTIKEDIAEIKKDLKENSKDVNDLKISFNRISDSLEATTNKLCYYDKKLNDECPESMKQLKEEIDSLKETDIKFGIKQQIIWASLVFIAVTLSNIAIKYYIN